MEAPLIDWQVRPLSPADPTPIVVEGQIVPREDVLGPEGDDLLNLHATFHSQAPSVANTPTTPGGSIRPAAPHSVLDDDNPIIALPPPLVPTPSRLSLSRPPTVSIPSRVPTTAPVSRVASPQPQYVPSPRPQYVPSPQAQYVPSPRPTYLPPQRPVASPDPRVFAVSLPPALPAPPSPAAQSPPPVAPSPSRATSQLPPTPPGSAVEGLTSSYPDYDSMPRETQDRYFQHFSTLFSILRNNNPSFTVVDPQPGESLRTVHIRYDDYIYQIWSEQTGDEFREYLIYLWVVIELVGTKVMGANLGGFTKFQLSMMPKYDRILIQLGQQHADRQDPGKSTSAFSPMTQLLVTSLINAVIFWGIKFAVGRITTSPNAAAALEDKLFEVVARMSAPRPQPRVGQLAGFAANAVGYVSNSNDIIGSFLGAVVQPAPAAEAAAAGGAAAPPPARMRPRFDG